MTEEEYAALSPEQRAELNASIKRSFTAAMRARAVGVMSLLCLAPIVLFTVMEFKWAFPLTFEHPLQDWVAGTLISTAYGIAVQRLHMMWYRAYLRRKLEEA